MITHLGLVIEQTRPRDPLLVASAEGFAPFTCGVPAAFTLDDVVHLHDGEDCEEVVVCHSV